MQINVGDRFQIVSLADLPVGGWLNGEWGVVKTELPNDRVVLQLDRQIAQDLAIALGYDEGFAVVQKGNLFNDLPVPLKDETAF